MSDGNYHLMGKRRFMSALTGLGVSGTAASLMSTSTLAELTDNPEKEVPRAKWVKDSKTGHGKGGVEYYTIPRDEWIYTESRFKAGRKLKNKLSSVGLSAEGIDIVVTESSGEKVVSVEIKSEGRRKKAGNETSADEISRDIEELKSYIPETVRVTLEYAGKSSQREVPVIIEESKNSFSTLERTKTDGYSIEDTNYYDHELRPIPGGAMMEADTSEGVLDGSLCTYAYDYDLEDFVMITAAHVVNQNSWNDVGQHLISNDIGVSRKIEYSSDSWWTSRRDVATIETHDQYDTIAESDTFSGFASTTSAVGGDYTAHEIGGYVTNSWMKDNVGNESLYYRGNSSGEGSGLIDDIEVDYDYVTIETGDAERGDSGGPFYGISDETYIAGVIRDTDGSVLRGTLFENARELLNVGIW